MLIRILKATKVTKKIYFPDTSKDIIQSTVNTISQVASTTFGPHGRNVLIENQMQQPRITKDGITVVKHIQFENRLKDAIATLIKKSVDGTNKYAGDGTTTSTILIGAIINQTYKRIAVGYKVGEIRKGLQIGRDLCLQFLDSCCKKIETNKQLDAVIMISTNRDKELSQLLLQVLTKTQNIRIEKSERSQNHIEYFSGISIPRGLQSDQFSNHNSNKVIYNYPLVLTFKFPLKNIRDIIKSLQMAKRARKQLIIFAPQISQTIMSTLIYNNKKRILEVSAVTIPLYGQAGSNSINTISQLTGSYLFHDYSVQKSEDIDWQHFGKAIKIQSNQFQTKIEGINKKSEQENAVIYVGAKTGTLMLQKYDKLIDALNSAKSARKDGVIAGGGITFWKASQFLQNYEGQGQEGVKVLAQALKVPRKKLMQYVSEEKKALSGTGWQGYDINSEKIVDMFSAGIIDSVNVGKSSIIDAVSLCNVLIEVEVSVARQSSNMNKISLKDLNKKYKL